MEFFQWLQLPRTEFSESVFSLIDNDNSSALDFPEFVASIGTICLFERTELLKFVFFAFDKAKAGSLAKIELAPLFCGMHGVRELPKNEKDAVARIGGEEVEGKMGFEEFCEADKKFPRLFAPAQTLQAKMIENSFGFEWWDQKRAELQEKRALPFVRARTKCNAMLSRLEEGRRYNLRGDIGKWHERWAQTKWQRLPARVMEPRVEPAAGSDIVCAGHGEILAEMIGQAAKAIREAEETFAREWAAEAAIKASKEGRLGRSMVRKKGRRAVVEQEKEEAGIGVFTPPLVHEAEFGKLRKANKEEAAAAEAEAVAKAAEQANYDDDDDDDDDEPGAKKKKKRRRRKKNRGEKSGKTTVHPGDGSETSEQVVQSRIDAFEQDDDGEGSGEKPEFVMSEGMKPMAGDQPLQVTEL